MKHKNLFNLLTLFFISSITLSQTIIDDFSDGDFTSNQTWSGSTSSFSVITEGTLPNGSSSTDGSYLASNASEGDISLAIASNEVSEWRFSLGSPDYNPSSSNYIGVVLMASASFSGDMVNNNFQGYYLRIGTSGSDPIALYRKTGSGTADVGDFPKSPSFETGALKDGLNIRVTRSSAGIFELFYSVGFNNNALPTKSAGTLTNNQYTSSSFFGVYQNIGSPSASRRVYIDDIELGVVTWNGSDSNDWSTANNWSTNSIPTSTDNIIIPDGLTNYPSTSSAISVNSVKIASGASLIANNSFIGNITYSRAIDFESGNLKAWYLMASPVNGETYDDTFVSNNDIAVSNSNRGIATYNTTNDTWSYLQGGGSGTFTNGQGYSIKKASESGVVSFTGTLNTNNSGVDVTLDNSGNRFNLLGNPYTSYLNSATFLNNEGAISETKTIWVWNQSLSTNGAYEVKDVDDAMMIAPGQGFFVKANAAGGTFNFTEANQTHNSTDTFQKSTGKTQIKLWMSDGDIKQYSRIKYLNNATTNFDLGYEGELFDGTDNSFAIYSNILENEGKKYQLQSLPNSNYENMVIPIGVIADANKEITFSTEVANLPEGLNVYFEDRTANTFTQLDEENSEYKITLIEKLDGIGRFYLHTKSSALNLKEVDLKSICIYQTNNSNLMIAGLPQGKSTFKLINLLGKEILNNSFASSGNKEIVLSNLASGIYIVQLETESGKLNKKITLE